MSKTPLICALVMALGAGPALAGPKAIKGQYKCKGTVTKSFFMDGIDSGPREYPIKAKLLVFGDAGEFYIDVLTNGHQVSLLGTVPVQYTPTFVPRWSSANAQLKGDAQGCEIRKMFMWGSGDQNKNGRKVGISISQIYACAQSSTTYTDSYSFACKR